MTSGVFLVGAGPGDPELLTLRAARLLAAADVVLHDALVDPRILALAPQALRVDVGKRCRQASASQRFIGRMLVVCARRYACVVRLKGGDPAVFGRLDEELAALRAAGIACAVVPGITAACAAAAAVQAPLTLRTAARGVTLATPSLANDAHDVAAVAAQRSDTVVVYMGGRLLAELASALIQHGRAPSTPLVIVENASLPAQRRWGGTLDQATAWPGARDGGPVLVMVGAALAAAVVDERVEGARVRDASLRSA